MHALRSGDDMAAEQLWNHYFTDLMKIARARMQTLPRAVYDEEDAAISTFRVLCEKMQAGRYPALADRDELWKLMLRILVRKISRRAEYEATKKRTTPETMNGSSLAAKEQQADELVVADECEQLFRHLNDPNLQQVVLWKLDGFTNDEIAAKLKRTRRTVQRMLTLIRDIWREECRDEFH